MAAGRHKEPETHLHNPPLQIGRLWRDEENSRAEQQWTKTHLYGWISSIYKLLNCIKVILFHHMALLLLTGLFHVLLHHRRNDKTKNTHSALFAQCHFSILIDFKNTDILFSWIPHHYYPDVLHKHLFLSPQFHEKSKSQPLALTAVELSLSPHWVEVAVLQSPHGHQGVQKQRQIGREERHLDGGQSTSFSDFCGSRELSSFIAAASRSARTSHAESLLER